MLGLALALFIGAAGCGTDDNSARLSAGRPSGAPVAGADDSATLSGAGATFPATIVQEWIKQYRSLASGVTVNYQPIGSGAGIQQLTSRTVDFAGSDVPLKESEVEATGGPGAVVQVPWTAGGVAGFAIPMNRVVAKVSRVEVATKFLSPPPEKMLRALVTAGLRRDGDQAGVA